MTQKIKRLTGFKYRENSDPMVNAVGKKVNEIIASRDVAKLDKLIATFAITKKMYDNNPRKLLAQSFKRIPTDKEVARFGKNINSMLESLLFLKRSLK